MIAGTKRDLCITTDAVVEGVHFTRDHFSFEDIGHKALAVNLSDLAAMGATPVWFVCAIAHPADFAPAALAAIARGMSSLARASGAELVGGNFTRASELSITVTAAGEVPRGKAVTRSGARAGELLFVTGELGGARWGFEALQAGRPAPSAIRRQRRPTPRLDAAAIARRFATAGMDVSDGLVQDLGHLCAASRVGARVVLEDLPVARDVRRARPSAIDAALYAAQGGEDYELLMTVPARRAAAFRTACERAAVRVTSIGEVTRGRGVQLVRKGGGGVALPPGFDHFQSDRAG